MSHAPDPRQPGVEVFDRNVFHELLHSLAEPQTVAALYRKFVENAAAFVCELRDQDSAARIDTLHTLKGSAAMMGANHMAKVAMHWQTQLQCASVQVAQMIEELEGELVTFRAAAAAQLHELGASLGDPE